MLALDFAVVLQWENGFRYLRYPRCWLQRHSFNWLRLCWGVTELEYGLEEPSCNTLSFSPSHRQLHEQTEKADSKPEWRVHSHFAGSAVCWKTALLCAGCWRPCWLFMSQRSWRKHFRRSNKHTTSNSELRKKRGGLSLLRAAGCKQYKKPKASLSLNSLFFLCLWNWSWMLFAHFLQVLNCSWEAARQAPQGALWEGGPGLHVAYFFPFCFMCTTK